MKVLLIQPPATVYGTGILGTIMPNGILYLAGYVRDKGVEVAILDALSDGVSRVVRHKGGRRYGLNEQSIKNYLKKYKPDIVGISSVYTAYFDDVVEAAQLVKQVNKKILTVIGGAHVSIDPKSCLKKGIDIAVFGEGEATFMEIVQGKKLADIKGIAYRQKNKKIKNLPRELIKDLDSIPFPARDLLHLEQYGKGGPFNLRHRGFQIVSSRGCPNHCLYCSIHSVWQHSWRGRSAKNVVDEIEYLKKTYGCDEVSFQDDSVSVDKTRMVGICNELIKRKLNIKWTTPNGIAHWTLDKKLIKKMKQAGCYRITFGIESGDLETRRWVGKPYSLDQAKDLITYANSLGMWTLATNIIGFPYETREQIERTFNYAVTSGVDLAFFFILGPRPGTKIYEIYEKEGWLMKDKKMLFSEDVACDSKHFKGEELMALQKDLYRRFLKKRWLNPLALPRILNKIRNWEDLIYISRIGLYGLKLVSKLISHEKTVNSKVLRV